MLSNAYLLAKFRFDTAENERNFAEVCRIFALRTGAQARRARAAPRSAVPPPRWAMAWCGWSGGLGLAKLEKSSKILQIFGGLVLGCIKTNFYKKIFVWQHFSSSTRFAYFCTAAISKFSQKIGLKNQHFSWKFSKHFANVAKFAKFCQFEISKISAR